MLVSLLISVVGAQISDWDQELNTLLTTNPEVRIADRQIAAREAAIKVAGTLPDPKFEFSTALAPVETRNGPIENQLMLGQKFPLWGKLSRQEKIAVLNRELARQNARQVRLSIINQFETRFAQYVQITRSLNILNGYRAELESFRNVALTQYSTGQGLTQHPILKLQIEQTRVEAKTNDLMGKKVAVLESLTRLFNEPVDTVRLASLNWPPREEEPLAGWVAAATTSNPLLQSSLIKKEIATVTRELSEKQNLPDLVAGVTYTVVGPTDLPGAVAAGKNALGVKIGLNLPLWLGRNKARVESARQTEEASQITTVDVGNKVTERIETILAALAQTDETVALYENRLLPEAEQMLSSAYAAYKTGKISFLDLLDSERMTVTLKLEYERVLMEQRIGEANLRKVVGLLNIEG
ncbi:MAG: TolC family protein [Fidelibacterota bacterium]